MTRYAFRVDRETFEFDESKHPRGGDAEHPGRFSDAEGSGAGTKDDPIKTTDPTEAARLLGEGKYVELDQPRSLSTMLDRIQTMVTDAEAKGLKAPTYDLCKATVEGTSLFCVESQGIPRVRMPQLSGKPEPGSWADTHLEKNEKGEVDLGPEFVRYLEHDRGIDVSEATVPAEVLRASQNELNGVKVAGMTDSILAGTMEPGSIFTTRDDYVVDGHHRWAANIAAGVEEGKQLRMDVKQIDAPILKVLAIANNFTTSRGLPHAAVSQKPLTASGEFDPSAHPRDDHGKFVEKGGEGSEVTKVEGVGDVDAFLAANLRQPGEAVFEYQSRIVQKLDPEQRHEMLFALRERYQPVEFIAAGAERYRAEHGLPDPKVDVSTIPAPLEKGDRVARAFESTADQSDDPRVRAAYDDFKRQNDEMWSFATKPESQGGLGIKVDFWTNPDPTKFGTGPYATAADQAADLRDNHHITLESGLGHDHPLLSTDEYDRFRAVHDIFGHAGVGGGFDRHGEYQAWIEHRSMYTGPGADAMSTEYHGVNTSAWAGAEGSPGTGKALLLPDRLIRNPWDEHGNYVRAAAARVAFSLHRPDPALMYLAERLGLDSMFPARFDHLPWHFEQPGLTAAGWDESQHPRDEHGRFDGGGSFDSAEMINVAGTPIALTGTKDGAGTPDDPIYVGKDLDRAIELLAQDKSIRLDDNKVASVLVSRLGAFSQELRAKGEKAPDFDLCNVTVADTNLFCQGNKGIERTDMPQLRATAIDGSIAAGKRQDPTNSDEKISVEPEYHQALRDSGVSITERTLDASMLRATQNEINGGKTGSILNHMIEGTGKAYDKDPIWVTKDGYILDGHHRWAATLAKSLLEGGDGGKIRVHEVGMEIGAALDFTRRFTEDIGIRKMDINAFYAVMLESGTVVTFEWREEDHPRDHGKFADKEGGDDSKQIAKDALTVARKVEPAITADVVDIAGLVGGTMMGLGRPGGSPLKSESSLAKKIERDLIEKNHGRTREQIAAEIHDNVRYTMTFPGPDYAAGTQRALDALATRGYEVSKFKNTWLPEDRPYRGINMQVRDPDGYVFELQMHTPGSWDVKNDNHKLYDAVRDLPVSDPAYTAAEHLMQNRSMELALPPGADRLKV